MDNKESLLALKDACGVFDRLYEPKTLDNMAKYMGVHKVNLMKFMDENRELIILEDKKVNRTIKKVIKDVYTDLSEKPYTKQWYAVMEQQYRDVIRLEVIANYGSLIAYDLYEDESKYCYMNSKEKVDYIKNALKLEGPKWDYIIGGFGDSARYKAKGYKVEPSQMEDIKQLGFKVLIK